LKTEIEYRISEQNARSVFGVHEGVRINAKLRFIKLDGDDGRWSALAQIFRDRNGKGFYGWHIERNYSATEIEEAKLHLFQISAAVLPSAEECGTAYDDTEICPLCGYGRVQTSPLRLRITKMPKRAEIAKSWGGEVIVSARVARLLIDSGITGFGLGPVQRSKQGEEEPFSFSQTHSGRKLLAAAAKAGVKPPSPDFYVWINRRAQRDIFQSAVNEHERLRLTRRRLLGGTTPDWYQLFVTSPPVELSAETRFGYNPFDNDPDGLNRCPLRLPDHVLGLNLLSQVSLQGSGWDASDFVRSRGLVGVRRGLIMPQSLLFISTRLRELLLTHSIKGWKSEVAQVS
jgi:hypothetical protein